MEDIKITNEGTTGSNMAKIFVGLVIVLLLVGGYLLFTKTNGIGNTGISTTTNTNSTSTKTVVQGNGYTIERLPDTPSKPAMQIPNLDRPVTVYPGYPVAPEAKTLAAQKVKEIQDLLKKDTRSWANWINLGIYQKGGGDFEGALASWKYASYLAPSDYISLSNIGNLYAYLMKDNGQAEVFFKLAISKGPTQAYLYIQLAEVYRDAFSDKQKARDIIEQGLVKIPNDPSLLQMKESLK